MNRFAYSSYDSSGVLSCIACPEHVALQFDATSRRAAVATIEQLFEFAM